MKGRRMSGAKRVPELSLNLTQIKKNRVGISLNTLEKTGFIL